MNQHHPRYYSMTVISGVLFSDLKPRRIALKYLHKESFMFYGVRCSLNRCIAVLCERKEKMHGKRSQE